MEAPRVGTLQLGLCAAALLWSISAAAQQPPDVDGLLQRVGARIAEFYQRAQTVICIERSTMVPVGTDYTPGGFSRTVESELRVELEAGAGTEASVVRRVLSVNGRAPRASDKIDRNGCTDPTPISTEPLAFLLQTHRSDYRFRPSGSVTLRDRNAVQIDFESVDRRSRAELIEDKSGHPDCFDWTGNVAVAGRVWIDAETADVLQIERHLRGPVDISVGTRIQRRYQLNNFVQLVRDDTIIKYRTIAFTNPDERLLLPESIESMTLMRGGLQSARRTQTFSDYRRFVTAGRVVQ